MKRPTLVLSLFSTLQAFAIPTGTTKALGLSAPSQSWPAFPSQYHGPSSLNCSSNSYIVKTNDNGTWPYREYKSTNAKCPELLVEKNGEPLADGLIFLTLQNSGLYSYDGLKQTGPIIMTPEGDLVWSGPKEDSSNLRASTLKNQSILTAWSGSGSAASGGGASHGSGLVTVYDRHYNTLYTVCPSPTALNISYTDTSVKCVADVHESYVTENGSMLLTVYNISQADLTSVGGPANGYVRNSLAVELDIETSEILWIWNPQDHVPFNASMSALRGSGTNSSNPWDWFHINSIQSFNGGYLINGRGTWSSYFVNKQGDIEWELNGKTGGDFGPLPAGYNFSWEHHALLHQYKNDSNKLLYTTFDDANSDFATNHTSFGIALVLNFSPNGTKSLEPSVRLGDPQSPLIAYAEGSHDILPNGNHFLGYGVVPFMKEFGPGPNNTDVRYSAQFAYNNYNNTGSSYRAFKSPWHATPSTELSLVVEKDVGNDSLSSCSQGSDMRGYVSWNGATDVTMYRLYSGSGANSLNQTRVMFNQRGFETAFVVPEGMAYVQIGAMEGEKEVGKSNVVKVQ